MKFDPCDLYLHHDPWKHEWQVYCADHDDDQLAAYPEDVEEERIHEIWAGYYCQPHEMPYVIDEAEEL